MTNNLTTTVNNLSITELLNNDSEIIEVKNTINGALQCSKEISVYTQSDVSEASEYFSKFKKIVKNLDSKRLDITRPFDAKKKEVITFFDSLISPVTSEINRLETDINKWQAEQRKIAAEKAKKEREEAEAKALAEAIKKEEEMKAKAVENGTNPDDVIVEVPIIAEEIVKPVSIKSFNNSGVGMMKVAKWEVTDINLIPKEYFLLDEVRIGKIRRAHGAENCESPIPGIRFYFDETMTSR